MRVLLINDRLPASGIGRYTFSLFKSLTEVLGRQKISLQSFYSDSSSPRIFRALRHLAFILKIPKDYNIYHIMSHTMSMYSLKAKPVVVTVHDLIPYVFANDEYTPRPIDILGISTRLSMSQLTNANQIICVSEYTMRDLRKYINVDPTLIRVIHHGIDHKTFRPREKTYARKKLSLPIDKKIILNLGSEEPRKNIVTLIRAFHQLQKEVPNSILIRVGQKTENTGNYVRSLGLENKIMSIQNMKEVSLFYNAADIFAYPSYYEGFCFPILEAMASGCPVIAGNRTSIPEIVGDGGILIDPFDVDSFSFWMREILAKDDLKDKIVEKGLVKSKNYTWDKCARETLKVYNTVLLD